MSTLKSLRPIVSASGEEARRVRSLVGPKIGLLDHLGGGNLGDDATQEAVMQNFTHRWPSARIFAFCMNPDDTRTRHGIPAYAIRAKTWRFGPGAASKTPAGRQRLKKAIGKLPFLAWLSKAVKTVLVRTPASLLHESAFLIKSLGILRTLDLLVINGGGQLTESWGGPWKFPYTIFKWVSMARLARVRCIVLNVGAGPLTGSLSKYFIRKSLGPAHYVSFRDEDSRTLAQQIGFRGKSEVFPDSVYSLAIPALASRHAQGRGKSIVGLAPMAFCDPRIDPRNDPDVYDSFIRMLGSFGAWLIKEDFSIKLFCSDIGVDPPAVEDLEEHLRSHQHGNERAVSVPVKSTRELLAAVSAMDYVVTCRFHGVVFAHIMNKPVLALSHHPKVSSLMRDLGLSQYCVDIRRCDSNLLAKTFISMVSAADEIRERLADKRAEYKRELSRQFDILFPPQKD